MKRLILLLALFISATANAQVLVVKAGADGKVFEPSPLTLTAPVLVGPVISGSTTIGSGAVLTAPTITTSITPTANDGAPLGSASLSFSDLFLATGAVINYANGNVALTHTSGVLTLGTGNLIITTAGTAAGSVVTNNGTQTLTGKTLTAPVATAAVITSAVTAYASDGAITIASGIAQLSKAGVGAYSVAAPSSQNGTRITFVSTTANAHVVTFTGGTLWDGTDGANTTATFTAFPGASFTVVAIGVLWYVESLNAVTPAP